MIDDLFADFRLLKLILMSIAGVVLCIYGAKTRSVATVVLGIGPLFIVAATLLGQDEFGWCGVLLFVGACVLKVSENQRKRAQKEAADQYRPRLRR